MTHNRKNTLLLAGNVLLITLLIAICAHEGYWQRTYKRLFLPPAPQRTYSDNPHFHEEIEFGTMYQSHPSVVMLGNSFVEKIEWHELLGRCDVATRGVGGDLTDGILARLRYVTALHPKIVFIEGGINDLDLGRPAAVIVDNICKTALEVEASHALPVLYAITKVMSPYPRVDEINRSIDSINRSLHQFADKRSFEMIDLNPRIAASGQLETIYARKDGCHLTSIAYRIWADEIQRILVAHGI